MDFRYYQDLVQISSENMKIHSFFQFVDKSFICQIVKMTIVELELLQAV